MTNELDPRNLTRDDIFAQRHSHPAVMGSVKAWQNKDITWEQATYWIILMLLQENRRLGEMIMSAPRPVPIVGKFDVGCEDDPEVFSRLISESQRQICEAFVVKKEDLYSINEGIPFDFSGQELESLRRHDLSQQ